jgi:Anthrone oxygenase
LLTAQLALVIAAAFAGVAVYVGFCQHPARLQLDDRAMLMQWKPSYKHGAVMQASLALVGTLLGIAAWWQSGHWLWLAGAVSLILPWPFTLFVIKLTNDALLATQPDDAGPQSRTLLEKWGRLHAVRTGLGTLSLVLYLSASLSSSR